MPQRPNQFTETATLDDIYLLLEIALRLHSLKLYNDPRWLVIFVTWPELDSVKSRNFEKILYLRNWIWRNQFYLLLNALVCATLLTPRYVEVTFRSTQTQISVLL